MFLEVNVDASVEAFVAASSIHLSPCFKGGMEEMRPFFCKSSLFKAHHCLLPLGSMEIFVLSFCLYERNAFCSTRAQESRAASYPGVPSEAFLCSTAERHASSNHGCACFLIVILVCGMNCSQYLRTVSVRLAAASLHEPLCRTCHD